MVNFNFEFFFIVKGIDAQMSLILNIPLYFISINVKIAKNIRLVWLVMWQYVFNPILNLFVW